MLRTVSRSALGAAALSWATSKTLIRHPNAARVNPAYLFHIAKDKQDIYIIERNAGSGPMSRRKPASQMSDL